MSEPRSGGVAGVVLAAGLGSRLAPFTDRTPKPLLPMPHQPLIVHLLRQLAAAGAHRLFVNLHQHADQIAGVLDRTELPVPLIHRTEARLTGPAGALTAFGTELADADEVLVVSGDVVSADPLVELLATHRRTGAALTFGVVRTTGARRYGVLDLDPDGRVVAAREKPEVADHEEHWISAGIYCLARRLVCRLPELAASTAALDYARHLAPLLLAEGESVVGSPLTGFWCDIGTPQTYRRASLAAVTGEVPGLVQPDPESPGILVAPTASLGAGVKLVAPVVIGADTVIGAGCTLADTVVLPGSRLPADTTIAGGLVLAPAGGAACAS